MAARLTGALSAPYEVGLEMLDEAMFCSARLRGDGIIDARDRRRILGCVPESMVEAVERRCP
jgi:hypothetical protein